MKTWVVAGMAALMLSGCNTLRGTGRDLQALGQTVTGTGHATAEMVQGMPHEDLREAAVRTERSSADVYAYGEPRQQPGRATAQQPLGQQQQQLQWRRIEADPSIARQRQLERASRLMAMNVVGPQGQKLGHLEQIVFDTERGDVTYAVVSLDGDRYAVPWQAISMPERQNHGALTLQTGPGQQQRIGGQADAMQDQTNRQQTRGAQRQSVQGLRQASTMELIGTPISDQNGQSLGQIEDIVLDVQQGRAIFALLSVPDEPDRLAAVPFDAVRIQQRLVTRGSIQADQQTLQEVSFRENQRSYQDEQFARRVRDQFRERDDYWQTFAFPGGGPDQIDAQEARSIRGTIESVGTFRSETGDADGLRLRIRSDDGELISIHAGPRDYARRHGVNFNSGDEIMVRGVESQINGQNVFIATEIHKGETLRLRDEEGRPRWVGETASPARDNEGQQPQRAQPQQRETEQQEPRSNDETEQRQPRDGVFR